MKLMKTLVVMVCAIAVTGLSSCDKLSELTSSAKSWLGDEDEEQAGAGGQSAEISSVGKDEGKQIIANESRLVMVEYYSDT